MNIHDLRLLLVLKRLDYMSCLLMTRAFPFPGDLGFRIRQQRHTHTQTFTLTLIKMNTCWIRLDRYECFITVSPSLLLSEGRGGCEA